MVPNQRVRVVASFLAWQGRLRGVNHGTRDRGSKCRFLGTHEVFFWCEQGLIRDSQGRFWCCGDDMLTPASRSEALEASA